MVPSGGAQDTAEEQRLGHQGGRKACIQVGGAEAGEVPHGQTNVGDKGGDPERQVLCKEVHMKTSGDRQNKTPETDADELEGEESRLREKDKGTRRVDSKGSGECDRKGAPRADI